MIRPMKPLFFLPLLGLSFIGCKPQPTAGSDNASTQQATEHPAVEQKMAEPPATPQGAVTSEIPDDLPDEDEPTPGERLDQAIEKTGEGLQKAGEKTEEGLRKAGEKTEEGLRKAGQKTGNALQRLGEKIERSAGE